MDRVNLELLQESIEMRVRERIVIGKIHFILTIVESMGPAECEVPLEKGSALAISILEIIYVLASTVPADIVLG